MVAWLIGPFLVSLVFTRVGLRLPGSVLTANAWVLTSSPLGLLFKIGGGVTPSSGLAGCGRLDERSASRGRRLAGGLGDRPASLGLSAQCQRRQQEPGRRLTRPGLALAAQTTGRRRPHPLERDEHVPRGLARATSIAAGDLSGIYGILAYVTYFFARPAVIEVWRHGYSSGITSARAAGMEPGDPVFHVRRRKSTRLYDLARTEFNLYLRFITTPLVFLITLVAAGMAAEGIVSERAARDLGQLDRHAAVRARHPAEQDAGGALADARAPGDTAGPLDDRAGRGGHPSRRLYRFGARRSRVDLVDAGVWDLDLDRGEGHGRDDQSHSGARVSHDRHDGLAIPAAGTDQLGASGLRLSPFVTWLSLVSYRDVRNALAIFGLPGLAMDATSTPAKGRSRSP